MKDVLDREIMRGDLVVYGVREGNGGGLRFGIVLESAPDSVKVQYDEAIYDRRSSAGTARARTPDRILIVSGYSDEEIEQVRDPLL